MNRGQQLHTFIVPTHSEKQFAWKYPDKSQEILLSFELKSMNNVYIVDQNKEKEQINNY